MSIHSVSAGIHRVFLRLKKKSFREDLVFFLAVVIAGSLFFNLTIFLTAIISGHGPSPGGLQILGNVSLGLVIGIIQGLIGGVVLLLGTSLVEHFFLLLVDVRNNFEMTVKSAAYALAPAVLFYWLIVIAKMPPLYLLLLVWFGVITYFGATIFHGRTVDRAVFVSIATSAVLLFLSYEWLVRPGLLAG
jgi:hypothetical protein